MARDAETSPNEETDHGIGDRVDTVREERDASTNQAEADLDDAESQ